MKYINIGDKYITVEVLCDFSNIVDQFMSSKTLKLLLMGQL